MGNCGFRFTACPEGNYSRPLFHKLEREEILVEAEGAYRGRGPKKKKALTREETRLKSLENHRRRAMWQRGHARKCRTCQENGFTYYCHEYYHTEFDTMPCPVCGAKENTHE